MLDSSVDQRLMLGELGPAILRKLDMFSDILCCNGNNEINDIYTVILYCHLKYSPPYLLVPVQYDTVVRNHEKETTTERGIRCTSFFGKSNLNLKQ